MCIILSQIISTINAFENDKNQLLLQKTQKNHFRILQINAFLAILIIFVLKIGLTISPPLKAVNLLK